MTVENMREAVTGKYKDSSWAARVKQMSDNQVMAIYFRMSQAGMFSSKVALSEGDYGPRKSDKVIFYCQSCLGAWPTDNPNTTECRFCGSCKISTNPPKERILKHED